MCHVVRRGNQGVVVDFRAYLGFWPYWAIPYADETGDGLLRLMDRYSVDKALVTSLRAVLYEVEEGNDVVFHAAARHSGRLIPAAVVNPANDPDPAGRVRHLVDRGARALFLFPLSHGYRLRGDYRPLAQVLETAGRLGPPVVIPLRVLMNWGFAALSVEPVLRVAADFPGTKFVVGGFNYSEVADLVEGCQRLGNVWLETSGLTMMRGVEALVERLGPDRILCGTAMPLQYPGCGLVKVRDAFLPQEYRDKILGGNAEVLLSFR